MKTAHQGAGRGGLAGAALLIGDGDDVAQENSLLTKKIIVNILTLVYSLPIEMYRGNDSKKLFFFGRPHTDPLGSGPNAVKE
jgi:hypothetical protein